MRRPWQTVLIIATVAIVFLLIALASVVPFSSETARTKVIEVLAEPAGQRGPARQPGFPGAASLRAEGRGADDPAQGSSGRAAAHLDREVLRRGKCLQSSPQARLDRHARGPRHPDPAGRRRGCVETRRQQTGERGRQVQRATAACKPALRDRRPDHHRREARDHPAQGGQDSRRCGRFTICT